MNERWELSDECKQKIKKEEEKMNYENHLNTRIKERIMVELSGEYSNARQQFKRNEKQLYKLKESQAHLSQKIEQIEQSFEDEDLILLLFNKYGKQMEEWDNNA